MIRMWYTVLSAVLGCLIALNSGSDTQAQACGGGFAKFVVADSESTSVPDVTIELVAELPGEEYVKYKLRKRDVEYGGFSFKLSASEAEELMTGFRVEQIHSAADGNQSLTNLHTEPCNHGPVYTLLKASTRRRDSAVHSGWARRSRRRL
jgi:hypothetical protein